MRDERKMCHVVGLGWEGVIEGIRWVVARIFCSQFYLCVKSFRKSQRWKAKCRHDWPGYIFNFNLLLFAVLLFGFLWENSAWCWKTPKKRNLKPKAIKLQIRKSSMGIDNFYLKKSHTRKTQPIVGRAWIDREKIHPTKSIRLSINLVIRLETKKVTKRNRN